VATTGKQGTSGRTTGGKARGGGGSSSKAATGSGSRKGSSGSRRTAAARSGTSSSRAASGSGSRSRSGSASRSASKGRGSATGDSASRSSNASRSQNASRSSNASPSKSAHSNGKGAASAESVRGTLARGAVGALVGGAALGVANRLATRRSRPKVLGTRLPSGLDPRHASRLVRNLDARKLAPHVDLGHLGKDVDVKDVLRRIGDLAEQVESRSEDVRNLSAQAKRLTRRLG